ncbi:hypothetical protein ACFYWN_29660 [Streptomyces sp. NPDC002917]|uniref:hypothetical protein n=1 Tax=Streptomyces sp. NPDC002917 TaxID=3364671 RepID=UPI0036B4EE7B
MIACRIPIRAQKPVSSATKSSPSSPSVARHGRRADCHPLSAITGHLTDAGLHVVAAEVTGQHTTTAERAAWLSIPVFAHPEGALSYEQKMAILAEATAQTKPDDVTVTSWLVIVAELQEES